MMAETIPTARAARRIAFVPRGEGCSRRRRMTARRDLGPGRPAETGTALVHPPGRRSIRGIVPSPDGRLLITACDDGSIRCWDAATGERIGDTLQHGAGVGDRTLALSPDGRMLISGGEDGLALRLGPGDGATHRPADAARRGDLGHRVQPRRAIDHHGNAGWPAARLGLGGDASLRAAGQGTAVAGLAVSPAGETFAAATAGGVVRMWDFNMLGHPVQTVMLGRSHHAGRIPSRGPDPGDGAGRRYHQALGLAPIAGDRSSDPGEPAGGGPVLPRRLANPRRRRTGGAGGASRDGDSPRGRRERPAEVTVLGPDGRPWRWCIGRAPAAGELGLRDAATRAAPPRHARAERSAPRRRHSVPTRNGS